MSISRAASQPIRRRMLWSLAAGLLLLVALAGGGVLLVASSHATLAAQTAQMNDLSDARRLLIQAVSLQETTILDYELSHTQRALDEYRRSESNAARYAAQLTQLARDDAGLTSAVDGITALDTAWHEAWANPIAELVRTGGEPPAAGPLSHDQGEQRFAEIEAAFTVLDGLIGARRIAVAASQEADANRLVAMIGGASLIFGVALLSLGLWLLRTVSGPLARLSHTATDLVRGVAVTFRAEHDDEVGTLAQVLEQLRRDVEGRYKAALADADRAATFNKLADLISFSTNEGELVDVAIRAIRRLTSVPAGDIELANESQNRLVYAGAWGERGVEIGRPVLIQKMDRCPGIRRASAYVVPDVEDPLAVHCPAHLTTSGAAACVPMMALGQVMGVIHLSFPGNAGTAETVIAVTRIAEQIAIALANTRLMHTLEGLAMTDSLTGLHNARFFDSYLETQLAAAERDSEPLAVIMMDIDHFKQINDAHGHPAGDEALRTFSRVVRSVLRASDVVARYGGEEFIVALRGTGQEDARRIAEKIREAVEGMVIEIGPGRYTRTTLSLGVVATDSQRVDQKGLVAMADAALYRAKEGGRNRVATAPTSEHELESASGRRRGRPASTEPIPIAGTPKAKPA